MPAAEVARHQKARLEGAMVEAVARHGYGGTTVRELVALAGVSKSTFYEHFDSKEDCFLATFDEIVAEVGVRVGRAYRSGGDFRQRLTAGLTTFLSLAERERAAATLVAVESLTLGSAGVAHRERGTEAFAALIEQSFEHSPAQRRVSETVVRGIVAGIRGVVYRRLRAGRDDELPGLVDELVDWVLSYQEPDSEATLRATEAAQRAPAAAEPEPEVGSARPPAWDESPSSRRCRSLLTQRERILRAAALVVVKQGYQALSIPAISAAAGTSNQTFYEHFASKRDAFLAAFDLLAAEVLRATTAAFVAEPTRPEAIGAGLRSLLEQIAGSEMFARLAFFELPTAGPVALDRADQTLDGFAALLRSGEGESELGEPLPEVLLEAIPSGVWAVIQHEIAHGRRQSLPELAPEAVRIVLAPFGERS